MHHLAELRRWGLVLIILVFVSMSRASLAFGDDSLSAGCAASKIPQLDHQRLKEVIELENSYCGMIWSGWETAPNAVLLVTPSCEYLIWHRSPTPDFTPLGLDSALDGNVFTRKRVFDTLIQAAFPTANGVPTVVIGRTSFTQPVASAAWILTVLHEHFHQWQQMDSDYGPATISLGLSGGDNTGMWMLNYPFPYDSPVVVQRFNSLCYALGTALDSLDTPGFPTQMHKFDLAREEFRAALSEKDYRYFAFQLWQEGVARYTEYEMALAASKSGSTFIPDSVYLKVATVIRKRISDNLVNLSLARDQRIAFYRVGAAEALLLDRIQANWHNFYKSERFSLDSYFPK